MKRIVVIALVVCMLNSSLMAYADTETAFPILDEITVLDITEHSYTVKVVIKNASENTTVKIHLKNYTIPQNSYAEMAGERKQNSSEWYFLVKLGENETPYDYIQYVQATQTLGEETISMVSRKFYTIDRPPATPPVDEYPLATIPVQGDVDCNGSVTLRDALAVLKHIAKIEELKQEVFALADMNSDHVITAEDVYVLWQMAIKH